MKITLDEFMAVVKKNAADEVNKEVRLDDLLGDVGIDSLGFITLLWDVEETFNISIDDQCLEHLNYASTVSDLISTFGENGLIIDT